MTAVDEHPHLSGWCSPTDQYHKGCKIETCECPNHADRNGEATSTK